MTNYLRFILIFIWTPLIILGGLNFELLVRYRKTLLLTIFFTLLFGIPWDALSVGTKLWWYNLSPTLGNWYFLGLPIEEFILTMSFPILVGCLVFTFIKNDKS